MLPFLAEVSHNKPEKWGRSVWQTHILLLLTQKKVLTFVYWKTFHLLSKPSINKNLYFSMLVRFVLPQQNVTDWVINKEQKPSPHGPAGWAVQDQGAGTRRGLLLHHLMGEDKWANKHSEGKCRQEAAKLTFIRNWLLQSHWSIDEAQPSKPPLLLRAPLLSTVALEIKFPTNELWPTHSNHSIHLYPKHLKSKHPPSRHPRLSCSNFPGCPPILSLDICRSWAKPEAETLRLWSSSQACLSSEPLLTSCLLWKASDHGLSTVSGGCVLPSHQCLLNPKRCSGALSWA